MRGKGIFIVFFIVLAAFSALAQEVTLITSGEGATKKEALDNALVAAVEQAYGIYVSGDTHILNDELIRDEVIQIKRGNITKYSILNESQISRLKYSAIVEATVSADNLLKFAQSKGAACELAGKTLAANVALKKLYIKNGVDAMRQLYNAMGYVVPKMYDYKLEVGDPIVFNDDVYVSISIDCVLNDNYDTFVEMFKTTDGHVKASIESANVQGSMSGDEMKKLEQYRQNILELPNEWIFGFKLTDNIGGEVYAVKAGKGGFWPKDQCAPYKFNGRYNGKTYVSFKTPAGIYHELPENQYLTYNKKFVIESRGPKIQELTSDALCSGERGGKNLLKSYYDKLKDKIRKQYPDRNYSSRGYDADDNLVTWNYSRKKNKIISDQYVDLYTRWIDDENKGVGKTVCTINFILCYKEADIARISDIKITPIVNL